MFHQSLKASLQTQQEAILMQQQLLNRRMHLYQPQKGLIECIVGP